MTFSSDDERPDVGCFHQVFPGVGIHRDAPGRESFHIGREVARGPKAGCSSPRTAPGGSCCPPAPALRRPPIASMRSAIHAASVSAASSGRNCASTLPAYVSRCAADQPLPVAVSRIAQLRGHELLKNEVDARHHLRGRTEVGVQRQQGVLARQYPPAGAGGPPRRAGPASGPAFPGRCWGRPAGSGRCSASGRPRGRGHPPPGMARQR